MRIKIPSVGIVLYELRDVEPEDKPQVLRELEEARAQLVKLTGEFEALHAAAIRTLNKD